MDPELVLLRIRPLTFQDTTDHRDFQLPSYYLVIAVIYIIAYNGISKYY